MPVLIEKLNKNLESIALEVVTMDIQDIPSLGNILNSLGEMEKDSTSIKEPAFSELIQAIKGYLEKIIIEETVDVTPLEEGIDSLQTIFRHVCNQKEYNRDISQILNRLGCKKEEAEKNEKEEFQPPDEDLSEEDRQILSGFVIESIENLDTIEVSLMDLEQDPNDTESINSIFRSFHTIKGVSGFLNLVRINKLGHCAENLLDKVRSGEIAVQETIVDIILESADLLKKLIQGVQTGLEMGTALDIGLDIAPLINRIDEIQTLADQLGDKPVGEILIHKGEISPEDLETGLDRQKEEPDKKIGQILVQEKHTGPEQVVSALRDQKKFGSRKMDLQVKVNTKKLDNLVDLTGELVIAQSMLRQNQALLSNKDQKLAHNLGQLSQITSSLQTMAMSMRMVPIKSTFQKMVRLVRDLAKNSGKEVQLKMSGEDTEIDRNVVDELYEPMVHMIRNSVDHGIETPEERKKEGKNQTGEIHLKAYHQGGKIIVEISDDGKGLDKDRIIAKANQLITDEGKLTDSEIYNMIFQPGFSTAKQVSDVSGRGVGMDVVKKGIEKLRGRVEINTSPGKGSTFVISLPLTLAIIEGMVVRVGEERYVIPALSILESLRPARDQYSTVEGKGEMILSRNKLFPLIRLNQIFNVECSFNNPWEGLIVIVEHDGRQMGLMLDELLSKEEVVIKNLGDALKDIKGIAGGAIMGDGRVGLILDMAGIWEVVKNS
jgi:two-component system, chemotaxis family, sensor kinase CheA